MKIAVIERESYDTDERLKGVMQELLCWDPGAYPIFLDGTRFNQAVDDLRDAGAIGCDSGEIDNRSYNFFELPSRARSEEPPDEEPPDEEPPDPEPDHLEEEIDPIVYDRRTE